MKFNVKVYTIVKLVHTSLEIEASDDFEAAQIGRQIALDGGLGEFEPEGKEITAWKKRLECEVEEVNK